MDVEDIPMKIETIESLVYRRNCVSLDNYNPYKDGDFKVVDGKLSVVEDDNAPPAKKYDDDAWDEEAGAAQVADAVAESIAVGVDCGELPSSALQTKYKPKLKRPPPTPSPSNPPPPTPSLPNPPPPTQLTSNPTPGEHSTPKGVAPASPPLVSCSDAPAPGPEVEEEKRSWRDERKVVRKSASSVQSIDDDSDNNNNNEPYPGTLQPSESFVSVASTYSCHSAVADAASLAQMETDASDDAFVPPPPPVEETPIQRAVNGIFRFPKDPPFVFIQPLFTDNHQQTADVCYEILVAICARTNKGSKQGRIYESMCLYLKPEASRLLKIRVIADSPFGHGRIHALQRSDYPAVSPFIICDQMLNDRTSTDAIKAFVNDPTKVSKSDVERVVTFIAIQVLYLKSCHQSIFSITLSSSRSMGC